MSPHDLLAARELHSRVTDGLHVRLLWNERDDRVVVAVVDRRTGDAFSVLVQAGERALDVFHHPFAYAASHGTVLATLDAAPSAAAA